MSVAFWMQGAGGGDTPLASNAVVFGDLFSEEDEMKYVKKASVVPTVGDSVAYTAGDVVGSLQEVEALHQLGGDAILTRVVLVDEGGEDKDIDLVIFHENPANSTFTDNGPFDVADADLSKIAGVVRFTTSEQTSGADNAVYDSGALSLLLKGTAGDIRTASPKFYAVAVAREGSHVYDATDALTFTYVTLVREE